MTTAIFLAAALLSMEKGGVSVEVDSETKAIDPGRSVFLTVTVKSPRGSAVAPPDLRDRVRGFSLAEDFADEPVVGKDGQTTQVVNWKLVPEPCAKVYKIAPFVVGDFVAGPIYFDPPAAREAVTGDMEIDPKKDLPPLSWRLVGIVAAYLAGALAAAAAVWFALRYLARRVREHRMSPIERAWAELDRLIGRGLPARGRYKDFYVELTMVVRRYVQRKYGVKAPHLTTEEFFAELGASAATRRLAESKELREFLQSADMVKFAGVEATPRMADDATESARTCLKGDAAAEREGGAA